MTKQEAKKYSLIKWKYAKKTGCDWEELGKYLKIYRPNIYRMRCSCGYCEYYDTKFPKDRGLVNCGSRCPLGNSGSDTCNTSYQDWKYAKTIKTRKKYAEIIYNDIKES
jgi:hypothetical protein